MDNRKSNRRPNPKDTANIFSLLTWSWTIPLFKIGYRKILEVEDLYDPLNKDRSNFLGDRLETQWFAEQQRAKINKRRPSFLWAICRAFASEIAFLGLIHLNNELILRLGTPLFLGAVLKYFKPESNMPYETAMFYATGMVIANFVTVTSINHSVFLGYHLGGRVRIAVCSVIYRKALRLSRTALGDAGPGKIVNLIANDVSKYNFVFYLANHVWSAPLSTFIVMALLYSEIGWSTFIGMSVIFLTVSLEGYMGKLYSKYRLQTSLKIDERVRLMGEIISGVQLIKMYAWEKPFSTLVESARRLELKVVKKSSYIRGMYMTFFVVTTRIAFYGTLVTILVRGQELEAEKVYVFMSYFKMISVIMTGMFTRGFTEISEARVSTNRIQYFLMYEEFQPNTVTNASLPIPISKTNDTDINSDAKGNMKKSNDDLSRNTVIQSGQLSTNDLENLISHKNDASWSVKLNHATAKWDLNSTEITLDDVTVEVAKGKLYIVIGSVGSGKSSLIYRILGELQIIKGITEVNGSISFADQDAWVFGNTVRQNIIFGQKYDRYRYEKVVKVCDLEKDFQQFSNGDQTIVGEWGSSLSGGQRTRINLARAVYRQADIYLLDDPLSAVDAHVGKLLFEECIQNYLSKKTRILATHQLQYIKNADAILLVDHGKLYQYANYHEFLQAYPEYKSLIAEEKQKSTKEAISNFNSDRRFSTSSTQSRVSEKNIEDNGDIKTEEDAFLEITSRGTVKGSLLINYITSGSSSISALLVLILFVATQACVSLIDYFVSVLINVEESRNHYNKLHENASLHVIKKWSRKFLEEKDILPRDYYIYIYSGLVVSICLVALIRSILFYNMCLRSSQRLHDLAFGALIRATMRFFDTNPSGRILNRFSKDLAAIDELLPKAMLDAGQSNLIMFGAVIITCTVNFLFLLPLLLIGGSFYFIRRIYLKTSKNIKRLEGMTRSPVFTHLNATLHGLTTIRADQAENILKEEFDKLQDTHTSSWYMSVATNIAFAFSLDVCCVIFTGVIVFSFVLLKDHFTAGVVGLAITQMMILSGLLQWGIRQTADVTNQLMSVERMLEYSQLSPEPNLRDRGILMKKNEGQEDEVLLINLPGDWPAKGRIEFKNVSMRYGDEDPPVLKNLSFIIQPSQKVGIVGRTGAGKSSLISALFRLAKVEGIIEIDGIDTGTIALEDLRKRISIIPQDPVLFSGTLRRNLDSFNDFSDKRLWEVLEEVELKDAVTVTGSGLDHRVQDRGSNYSTGQRQLICLARAILRNNRILMLDEATANVDPHTDALIQRTIRTKFAPCTVLTVAHRLNTIIDSDKVLVMDEGRLVEFNHPHVLLQNENGLFLSLVKEIGQATYAQLKKIAYDDYISKYGDT